MFLSLNNDNALTSKFIKSINYKLDPIFKEKNVHLFEPPFLLSRVSHGNLFIEVEVEFQG